MRAAEGKRGRLVSSILYSLALFVAVRASAQALPALDTITVASGLTRPVFVTAPPGDYGRLFIVEQGGRIRILNLQTGVLNVTPFLTVTGMAAGNEQGLLGLAFDPSYATNGKFYILYTDSGAGDIRVVQYQVSGNPDIADTTAANIKTVITFTHPQTNHNAGWIGFSPRPNDDHNFYISSGDGGNGDDQGTGHIEPGGNAQNNTTLLGKMLRIHVDPATAAYTIPADNPFAGSSNAAIKKEIWLLGLRNPYRDSFDRVTRRMFLGDVGQASREEIDVQQPTNPGGGENYGWRDREGLIQNPTYATATPTPTPVPPRVNPILDYPRTTGTTVTGGNVYRGKQIPGLRGTYVFGDYSTTKIFSLDYDGTNVSNFQTITSQLFPTVDATPIDLQNPSSFGEDSNGELYITDLAGAAANAGRVYKIVPVTPLVKIDSIVRDSITGRTVVSGTSVPFKTLSIQATNNPAQWSGKIGDVTALGDGTFVFDDGTNPAPRFFRAAYPALPAGRNFQRHASRLPLR
ncbi:MAG: PQQ-dependent sugar dehydrogenase [Spartobacteria bacterium]